METEIQKINRSSPLAMASDLIGKDSNMDVDKLAKLLEVQERWEANEARKAYVESMAAFKADPPKIVKDKHVKYATSKGTTDYHHASLKNVTETINKSLSLHGFTSSWVTKQDASMVTVTCRITHVLGHYEETTLSSAPDASGGKNPIQAIGSAVSYLQRYTLLSLVGLATEDQDDDGNGIYQYQPIDLTKDQENFCSELKKAIEHTANTKIDYDKLVSYLHESACRKKKSIPSDESNLSATADFIAMKPEIIEKIQSA